MLDLYESLAAHIKCPPDMLEILKSIIPEDSMPLLICLINGSVVEDVSERLDKPVKEIEQLAIKLYRAGFLSLCSCCSCCCHDLQALLKHGY